MARAALFALVIAAAPLREACAKRSESRTDPPPPPSAASPALPLTSATTPPIWTPPDPGPAPAAPPASANPDLTKARAAAQSGDHKKVRALLEKKVKAGKSTREEASLLLEACTSLRDKPCIELVKAKHPDA